VEFERKLQEVSAKDETATSMPYLHPSLVPLNQVNFLTDTDFGQMELWNTIQNECSGMCGV
jgi:hypothetical protein